MSKIKSLKKFIHEQRHKLNGYFNKSYITLLLQLGIAQAETHSEKIVYDNEACYVQTGSNSFRESLKIYEHIDTSSVYLPHFYYEPYFKLSGVIRHLKTDIVNKQTGKLLGEFDERYIVHLRIIGVFECKSILLDTMFIEDLLGVSPPHATTRKWIDTSHTKVGSYIIEWDRTDMPLRVEPYFGLGECLHQIHSVYTSKGGIYEAIEKGVETIRKDFITYMKENESFVMSKCVHPLKRVQD